MSEQDFVHLHLHTEYSLLDGFARIEKAVNYAKELGMPSLAITDHGTMFGVIDFYKACKKAGIHPIIGVEAYLAKRTRFDRDPQQDNRPYHMLLLAKDGAGYRNLLKLTSLAQLEGYYYRPRIDWDTMAKYSGGIIATSGCLAAQIPQMVERGRDDEARALIGQYQETFGRDNFYLELQAHDIPELNRLNQWLIDNAGYADVPLVATNDVHYVLEADYDPHDTLLCIQTSSLKSEQNRLRMTDNSYYMRTQAEMWRLFGDYPDALNNTLRIAEQCQDLNLTYKEYHLPVFPVPTRFDTPSDYLRYLCEKGLRWRMGALADDATYRQRLEHELEIIIGLGFETYFLIVWDLCEYARFTDIWWNVRGSGAGSLVAYSLGITSLDPLENGLIFERFLNPSRVSMPDFDLDYPEDRRAEMIEYCSQKYGSDKVAAIVTFGTLGAKGAIRDVGRALEVQLSDVDRITRTVPTVAKPPKIAEMLGDNPEKMVPDLKAIYQKDPKARQIIDMAMAVEGVPRHASTHAAGIIVADKPLDEYLPLHRPTKGDSEDSPVKQVTQFPMETAESIGLLKIDFLGLSTLTILRLACDLIERNGGPRFTMANIPYKPDPNDPEITQKVEETFEMIGKGYTVGVFQIESAGMRQMLTDMKPKTFEHIIAAISLYRPGPMDYIPLFNRRMHGEEDVVYHHEKLVPIVSNTYGILTYQEQIMQVAADLFGYAMGEADLMRRAVSKKKEKDLMQHRQIFLERGPQHGVSEEAAEKIFADIAEFANYGFNKSHAADYAVITCQTAFLKRHYPHEYMSALMSVYYDDAAKVSLFIADCRRMDINVLPPDVNHSQSDFSIEKWPDGKEHIRFGLGAIKNLGLGAIEFLLNCRKEEPFQNLDDFLRRCDMRTLGKRGLESLIKGGAMDKFGDRALLLANLDRLITFSIEQHKNAAIGQVSMFDLMGETNASAGSVFDTLTTVIPNDWDKREQLRWEKELLGLYISEHPLTTHWPTISGAITHTTAQLKENPEMAAGRRVAVAGLINAIRTINTKSGDTMAVLTLEDIQGTIEVVIFPRTWRDYRDSIEVDKVYIVRGEADMRGMDVQIKGDSINQDFEFVEGDEPEEERYQSPPFHEAMPQDEETGETLYRDAPQPPPPPEPIIAPATAGASIHQASLYPVELANTDTEPAEGVMVAPPPVAAVPVETKIAEGTMLVIVMERTFDSEQDRRRLRSVHGRALAYPGSDSFCIEYKRQDGRRTRMKFPDLSIQISDVLINDLRAQQGIVGIEIESPAAIEG